MSGPKIIGCYPNFVAVYKPPGMLVHRQHRSQTGPFLLQWLRDRLGMRVFPIHRLDKPTSGLMVFGLCPESAAALSTQFRETLVEKLYLAIVRGHLHDDGLIDYALKPVRDRLSSRLSNEAQDARTRYRVLGRSELPTPVGRYSTARYSLLELAPETGRRNQLRRHMKHLFHPVLGDRKYGDRDHNRFQEELGFRMLALCSIGLSVNHPTTGERLELFSAPNPEWLQMAEALGFNPPLCSSRSCLSL